MDAASKQPPVDILDPADVPIHPWSAPEPARAPLTSGAAYTRERARRQRLPNSNRTVPTPNRPRTIPPGIRLVTDGEDREWTDVYGAAVLGGVCRRTIYAWKQRGWLKIRYLASGKMEVLVESLWWSEADRARVIAAAQVVPGESVPLPDLDEMPFDVE